MGPIVLSGMACQLVHRVPAWHVGSVGRTTWSCVRHCGTRSATKTRWRRCAWSSALPITEVPSIISGRIHDSVRIFVPLSSVLPLLWSAYRTRLRHQTGKAHVGGRLPARWWKTLSVYRGSPALAGRGGGQGGSGTDP